MCHFIGGKNLPWLVLCGSLHFKRILHVIVIVFHYIPTGSVAFCLECFLYRWCMCAVCAQTHWVYILLHTFHGNHYYYDLIANEVEIERNHWKRWTNERKKLHMICICVLLVIDQLFISHNAELQRRDDACFVSVFDWNFSKGLFYNLFCISVPHRASLNISKRILLCLRGWSFCRAVCPCLDSRFFLLQPSIALSLCRLSTGSNYKKFQQFFFLSLLL